MTIGEPRTSDKLHLHNFIDRVKLEHAISKSIRGELPFVVSFVLVFVFLFLERPDADYLDFLSSTQRSLGLDGLQGMRNLDQVATAFNDTQSKLTLLPHISIEKGSTVVQTTAPMLTFGVSPTKVCTNVLSSKYTELWQSSGLMHLAYGGDWDGTVVGEEKGGLRCLDVTSSPQSATLPTLEDCDGGVLPVGTSGRVTGNMQQVGVILPCKSVWAEFENSSKYGDLALTFGFYGTPSEFIALVNLRFSLDQSGVGDVSYSISVLPSIRASKKGQLWESLGIISTISCAITLLLDLKRTVHMARLFPGKYRCGIFSYKQFLSLCLLGVALSRLLLHYYIFDQITQLKSFYTGRDYTYTSLHALYTGWKSLIRDYSILNFACLVACVLCSYRVLEIPHAHPRIAMLTETFVLAKAQLVNFAFTLLFVMFLFAVVANLLLMNSDYQRRFGTVYKVMKQQSKMLVGVWPFDGALDNYNSFLNICYLVGFGFLSFFVLIAFFQVILVDNFKRYKIKVEENVTENSFFKDAMSMIRQNLKSRYSSHRWPHRLVIIGILEMLRDQTSAVTGSSEKVEFGVFAERLSWLHSLTADDVESAIMRDPGLAEKTKINLKKCIIRERNTQYDPLAAADVWSWYTSQFGSTKADFLNAEFSLDAHRSALRCKQILRDFDVFRLKANSTMTLTHKLTNMYKDASATVKERIDIINMRNSTFQNDLDVLHNQLEQVGGVSGLELETTESSVRKTNIASDERLLLGFIRVIEKQNRELAATAFVRKGTLRK